MDINITGTFIPCKVFGELFIQQGFGKIVNTSSVRAFAGHPGGYAAYGTSKGAINLLTKQLATEWAKYNINVNAVAPTIFWTPLTQEVLEDEKLKKIFLDRIPMGRAAVVEDMVGTVVYLCSPAANFITGQVIYIDGGCTAGLGDGDEQSGHTRHGSRRRPDGQRYRADLCRPRRGSHDL